VVVAVVVLIGLVWLATRVDQVDRRLAEVQVQIDNSGDMPALPLPTTLPPPIDVPPPDADVARRAIVAAMNSVFSSDLPAEQRVASVSDPGDLVDRFAALAGGPCSSGTEVIVTDIRFEGDDLAWVQFRFEGPGVPDGGTGVLFDGSVRRRSETWLLDPALVGSVLDMSMPYCGASPTTLN